MFPSGCPLESRHSWLIGAFLGHLMAKAVKARCSHDCRDAPGSQPEHASASAQMHLDEVGWYSCYSRLVCWQVCYRIQRRSATVRGLRCLRTDALKLGVPIARRPTGRELGGRQREWCDSNSASPTARPPWARSLGDSGRSDSPASTRTYSGLQQQPAPRRSPTLC